MKHHGADTSPFPTRLSFAGVCPAYLPSHVGLNSGGALKLERAGYPTVAVPRYTGYSWLNFTRFSVNRQ